MFSDRARRALSLAQKEAQSLNHNYIGTEHLLLALTSDTEGAAARVLSGLRLDLNEIRTRVELHISRGENPTQEEIGLTSQAKKVVELAVDESRRISHRYISHRYIGTEHLLTGLLREGEGVAAGVLESLGVTLEAVRAETHRIGSDVDESQGSRDSASAQITVQAEEIIQRLANLENTLNSQFNQLVSRMDRLEQLLRDR
ncbi:MAG: hypothetical protein O2860_06600 [Chloroflexi bacterium]|nr:hypothetical protein [Chloroflexota bacterium]